MQPTRGCFRVLAGSASAFALVVATRGVGAQAASKSPPPFTYQAGWPASCSAGVQSPITFVGASTTPQTYSVAVSTGAPHALVAAHAHTADFVFSAGAGSVTVGSSKYALESFHLHFPVEHQLPNTGATGSAPATFELHVKTKDATGRYAVFGVQFVAADSGVRADSGFFAAVIHGIRSLGTGTRVSIPMSNVLGSFMNMPFYSYVGSTTSPNCDPNVTWYVLYVPLPVKTAVVDEIHAALKTKGLDATNARLMTFAGPPQFTVALITPKP